jgi:neurofibromin 1
MAQIIRAARSRLREGPSEERSLRPSDVPGTLLNVALLNLSSGDEVLRLGAYNLIYELSGYFKWGMALTALQVISQLPRFPRSGLIADSQRD